LSSTGLHDDGSYAKKTTTKIIEDYVDSAEVILGLHLPPEYRAGVDLGIGPGYPSRFVSGRTAALYHAPGLFLLHMFDTRELEAPLGQSQTSLNKGNAPRQCKRAGFGAARQTPRQVGTGWSPDVATLSPLGR
jgi:hypothetical protein